jgi:hypothetical protein
LWTAWFRRQVTVTPPSSFPKPRHAKAAPRLVVLGMVVIIFGLVGALNLGALNPEDEQNFNTVSLVNDTGTGLDLSMCNDDDCEELFWTETLVRGEREGGVQISNHSLRETFLIIVPGREAQCLTLQFDRAVDEEIDVPISRAERCKP